MKQSDLKDMALRCAEKIVGSEDGVGFFRSPYRHLIIDGFLDESLASSCATSFPSLGAAVWEHADDKDIEVKYRTTWTLEFDIPDGIVGAVRILNSAIVLRAMASRIGVPKIMPDPYFSGGGLNVTMPGGLLGVHVDGNYHDESGLNRRLDAILYLNEDWRESWGGELGLYDYEGRVCVKKIAPLLNRLIIFETHDRSFHGLPEPLNFPEGVGRKSIILYYYTKEKRPDEQVGIEAPHSALWVQRNLMDKQGSRTRKFK